jgi:hypothetical protein
MHLQNGTVIAWRMDGNGKMTQKMAQVSINEKITASICKPIIQEDPEK